MLNERNPVNRLYVGRYDKTNANQICPEKFFSISTYTAFNIVISNYLTTNYHVGRKILCDNAPLFGYRGLTRPSPTNTPPSLPPPEHSRQRLSTTVRSSQSNQLLQ